MTHDFYQYNSQDKKRINQFRKTDKGLFNPRLTKMELSTGFKLSGKQFGINQDKDTTSTTVAPDSINIFPLSTQNKSQGGALWNTRFSVGYSLNKFDPVNPQETFWMNTNSTINITRKWRVSYTARFDLMNKELISHRFSIYRDLHCWEMAIDWTPSGYASGVLFEN